MKFNVEEPPKLEFFDADLVDYSLVYYNVVLVYVCKNVKYVVNSASIVVDLRVLVKPKGRWDDESGSVYFYWLYNVVGMFRKWMIMAM